MKWRRKPIEEEAVLWDGKNIEEVMSFLGEKDTSWVKQLYGTNFRIARSWVKGGLILKTLEGEIPVPIGSYIVKGVKGESYPVRADIFLETREKI